MPALDLWLNIVLCTAAFGIIVGAPMWLIFRHPDRNPAENRRLPAYLRPQPRTEAATPTWAPPAAARNPRRVLAGRSAR
jgi:hypothetical protein